MRTESRDRREEGLGVGVLEHTRGSEVAADGGRRCKGEVGGMARADSWAEVDREEVAEEKPRGPRAGLNQRSLPRKQDGVCNHMICHPYIPLHFGIYTW